jgi:transposase
MRWFGLDVHRDFCEVAVADEEGVRSAGRIATRTPTLELFAQSLAAGDVVALEATTGADRIVAMLGRYGIRVVVANTRKLRSITEAKAKTDRLDARTLARLLASGLIDAGLDARRAHAGAATTDQPPRAPRAREDASEE